MLLLGYITFFIVIFVLCREKHFFFCRLIELIKTIESRWNPEIVFLPFFAVAFRLQLRWPHRHFISWTNSCKEKKQREITSYFITFPRSFEVFSNGFLARARARTHVRVLSYYRVCGEYGKTRTRECCQYRHRRYNFWDCFSEKQINSLPSVLVYLRDWVFTICSKELVEKTVE